MKLLRRTPSRPTMMVAEGSFVYLHESGAMVIEEGSAVANPQRPRQAASEEVSPALLAGPSTRRRLARLLLAIVNWLPTVVSPVWA